MRLTPYERDVQREIEKWQHGDSSFVMQAVNWAMQPVDWVVRQVVSPDLEDQAGAAVEQLLSMLNDASSWTYDSAGLLEKARREGLDVARIEDLREVPLETLDPLARGLFSEHAVMAAVEGGGAGLGGIVFIAADIPLLFTINLRLIQQIGAIYGFPVQGPEYRPLVLSIFNVAASGGKEAKNAALREVSVAAAAVAHSPPFSPPYSPPRPSPSRARPSARASTTGSPPRLPKPPTCSSAPCTSSTRKGSE